MSWYLQINGGAKRDFGALDCGRLKRTIRSQAVGMFTFTETAAGMDQAALASNLDECVIGYVPDGGGEEVIYFQGRVSAIPRVGAPGNEERRYVISDAWMDLERLIYQQQWNIITGTDESGNPTNATEYRSEFILGVDISGNAQLSDAAIRDVLTWAIARGARLQIGDILAGGGGAAPVPCKEMRDLPCSAVLQELLRLTPDAVTWMDYSVTPPRMHVTRRGACAAVDVGFSGVAEDIELSPRWDLVRSQVVIRYVQEGRTDGLAAITTTIDTAPAGADGLAFDALVATVRLAGANATYQSQPVTVTPVPSDGSESFAINWWQNNSPALSQFSSERLSIVPGSVVGNVMASGYDEGGSSLDLLGNGLDTDVGNYPNQLKSGTLANWMNVKGASCSWQAAFTYDFPDEEDEESAQARLFFSQDDEEGAAFSVMVAGTDAVSRTYKQLSSYTEAEPVPLGLAEILYSSLAVLHYEGYYRWAQAEVNPSARLGMVLNVTGTMQPWSAMNALVQEITDDLDEGRTTWRVGPPHHLTVQDLMEQLRYTRTRAPSGHIKERQTGTPGDSPLVNGASASAGQDSNPPGFRYPWIECGSEDGGATWDAVLGYGQSLFADENGNGGTLANFELSVGNDGSGSPAGDMSTGLSIISGNETVNNQIMIQTELGAIKSDPGAGTITITSGDGLRQAKMSAYDSASEPQVMLSNDDTGAHLSIDPVVGFDYVNAESDIMQIESAALYLTNHSTGGQVIIDAALGPGRAAYFQELTINGQLFLVLCAGPL